MTDAAGFATFQWTPTNPDGDSTIVVSEDSPANPPDPPGGTFVNLPDETECTFRTPDTDDAPLDIEVDDAGGFTAVVPPESIVTCQLVNIATPEPALDLEKFTNGVDADVPTGPLLELGDEVDVDLQGDQHRERHALRPDRHRHRRAADPGSGTDRRLSRARRWTRATR